MPPLNPLSLRIAGLMALFSLFFTTLPAQSKSPKNDLQMTVYLSCHPAESDSLNQLRELLRGKGVQIIEGLAVSQQTVQESELRARLIQSDYIITLLSEKYLASEITMSEFSLMWDSPDIQDVMIAGTQDKFMPLLCGAPSIFDVFRKEKAHRFRLYWQEKCRQGKSQAQNALSPTLCKEIQYDQADLLEFLLDHLVFHLNDHRREGYVKLFRVIDDRQNKLNNVLKKLQSLEGPDLAFEWEQVAKDWPDNRYLEFEKAKAIAFEGETEETFAAFCQRYPSFADGYFMAGQMVIFFGHGVPGEWEKGLKWIKKGIHLDPARGNFTLGQIFLDLDQMDPGPDLPKSPYDSAYKYFSKAISQSPLNPDYQFAWADLLREHFPNQKAKAVEAYQKGIQLAPERVFELNQGMILLDEFQKLMDYYEKRLDEAPADPDRVFDLYFLLRQYKLDKKLEKELKLSITALDPAFDVESSYERRAAK
ncbi:MAG: hypothetical protein H6581_12365 [Bacteroidia bacterium]|nr:hypothetical protein [Bacteroidia bacterium]